MSGTPVPEDIEISIHNFVDYFSCEIEKINDLFVTIKGQIDHSGSHILYQKILYCIILDALSRAAYPEISGTRERFIKLIEEFSEWKYFNRVSWFQLMLDLEARKIFNGKLYAECKRHVNSWAAGRIIRPDCDDLHDDVLNLATKEQREIVCNNTYSALLWKYRNTLVHEFREPGYGIETGDDGPEPYYHSMTTAGATKTSWELVFPVALFRNLCEQGLGNLAERLRETKRSPHASFDYGSYWRGRPRRPAGAR